MSNDAENNCRLMGYGSGILLVCVGMARSSHNCLASEQFISHISVCLRLHSNTYQLPNAFHTIAKTSF